MPRSSWAKLCTTCTNGLGANDEPKSFGGNEGSREKGREKGEWNIVWDRERVEKDEGVI